MSASSFAPQGADSEERVRASFSRQGAMTLLGAGMVQLAPGSCTIAAAYREDLSQQHGFFHAGVTSTIADSAGGYAALTLYPAESEVLTVEFKINLLAPAHGERLVAIGRVVRSGRTLSVCTIDAWVERRGARLPCALMQQTVMRVERAQ